MTLYVVRKRDGRWAICSANNVVLQFETYDEAIETARTAASVLKPSPPWHVPRGENKPQAVTR